jgi:hypothetical protein
MQTVTVPLKQPLRRGDTEITEITLREPDTGSLRGLETVAILRMDVASHAKLVPRLSNIDENLFYTLGPKDLVAVQQEVVGFFVDV